MTEPRHRPRLDPSIFNLPVERMRAGYYSDKYFVRAREILLADGERPRVTMQVFGKQHAFLGGIDEAIAILKLCADRVVPTSWCMRCTTATRSSLGNGHC